MRTISSGLATRIANEATTLCRLLTITPTVGTTVYRLVDLDKDITIGGHVFSSAFAFDCSAIQCQLGTGASSYTIDLALDEALISREMIEAGVLDNAAVEVDIIDFESLTDGSIVVLKGTIGEIEYKDKLVASINIETLLSQGLQIFVEAFTSNCRADLGDARCKVDIDALKKTFTVATAPNRQQFTTGLTDADGAFDYGLVLFTSGANSGFAVEVGSYLNAGGQVTLLLITPFALAPGDTGTIYPGCDKTLAGGCTVYANWLNFRGEPYATDPAVSQITSGSASAATVATASNASDL